MPISDARLQRRIDRAVVKQERDRVRAAGASLNGINREGISAVRRIIRKSIDDRAIVNGVRVLAQIADWGRPKQPAEQAVSQQNIQINFPLPHPAQAVEPADIIDRGVVMVQSRRDGDGDGNGHGNT